MWARNHLIPRGLQPAQIALRATVGPFFSLEDGVRSYLPTQSTSSRSRRTCLVRPDKFRWRVNLRSQHTQVFGHLTRRSQDIRYAANGCQCACLDENSDLPDVAITVTVLNYGDSAFNSPSPPLVDSELAAIVPRPLARALEPTHAITTSELPYTTTPVEVRLLWHERVEGEPSHEWLHEILRGAAGGPQVWAKAVIGRRLAAGN